MRDHDQPALREYLAAERAYYDVHAAQLAELTGRLVAESAGRIHDRPRTRSDVRYQDLSIAPGHHGEERIFSFLGHAQENLPRKSC